MRSIEGVVAVLGLFCLVSHAAAQERQVGPGRHQYDGVAIVQPAQEDTVHDNEGNLVVQVEVVPGLVTGDEVVVMLNGTAVARGPSTMFALQGLERGTHELTAQVVDESGNVLAASDPVTFFMWQASALFQTRPRPR